LWFVGVLDESTEYHHLHFDFLVGVHQPLVKLYSKMFGKDVEWIDAGVVSECAFTRLAYNLLGPKRFRPYGE
jgi:hypothetical protein